MVWAQETSFVEIKDDGGGRRAGTAGGRGEHEHLIEQLHGLDGGGGSEKTVGGLPVKRPSMASRHPVDPGKKRPHLLSCECEEE